MQSHSLPGAELDVLIIPQLIGCMQTIGPISPAKEFRLAWIHEDQGGSTTFCLTGNFNWSYQSEEVLEQFSV